MKLNGPPVIAILIGSFMGLVARGDAVTLTPSKDNTLYQDATGTTSKGPGDFCLPAQRERAQAARSGKRLPQGLDFFGKGRRITAAPTAQRRTAPCLAPLVSIVFDGPVSIPTDRTACRSKEGETRAESTRCCFRAPHRGRSGIVCVGASELSVRL